MRVLFPALAAAWVCAAASGCLAVAIGGGAVGAAYVLGDVDRLYPCEIDVVWDATQVALAELQLPPGVDSKDALRARIDRRTAAGDRIRITLTSQGQFTKLNLRVNTFGNRSMSQILVHRIELHLPVPPVDGSKVEFRRSRAWDDHEPPEGAAVVGQQPALTTAASGPDLPPSLPHDDFEALVE